MSFRWKLPISCLLLEICYGRERHSIRSHILEEHQLGQVNHFGSIAIDELELATPSLGPTLDDNFLLGEELDGIHALAVHIAEEGFLPATEGEESHGGSHADVYADIAGIHFVAELSRQGAAGGEQAGLGTLYNAVGGRNRFLERVDVHQAEHRSKDLGFPDLTARLHICQDGGAD